MLLQVIRDAWGWMGFDPAAIVDQNDFGHLIVRDTAGHYWHLCPEELSLVAIAANDTEYHRIRQTSSFAADWAMAPLQAKAKQLLGPLSAGRCYCFKCPTVLGGEYAEGNLGSNTLQEVVALAGDVARQIRDLPDGARVKFQIMD